MLLTVRGTKNNSLLPTTRKTLLTIKRISQIKSPRSADHLPISTDTLLRHKLLTLHSTVRSFRKTQTLVNLIKTFKWMFRRWTNKICQETSRALLLIDGKHHRESKVRTSILAASPRSAKFVMIKVVLVINSMAHSIKKLSIHTQLLKVRSNLSACKQTVL